MSSVNDTVVSYEARVVNDTMQSAGVFADASTQNFLLVISYLLIFIGIGAFIANLAIFLLLTRKPNKNASEMLVLCNLVIDAVYGLTLFSVGLFNVNDIYLSELTGILALQCIIRRVPYTFLILSSLFLLIVMTLNRYVAVKIPFRYKIVFKTSNVLKYLVLIAAVSSLFAGVDMALCIADPFEKKVYSEAFTLVWVYLKLILIVTITVLMFVMYNSISKQFVGNFWAPILLPFKAIFVCECHGEDDIDEASDIPSCTEPPVEPNHKRVSFEAAAKGLDSKEGGVVLESLEHDDETSRDGSTKFVRNTGSASNSCKSTASTTSGNCKDRIKTSCVSKLASRHDQKTLMEQRREQKKFHLTTMFFFISIIFILVSAPNSIFQVVSHWLPNMVSIVFSWKLYLMTETLYGLNFLLNPYLYSFNNSYIKQKFRELFTLRSSKKPEERPANNPNATSTKVTKCERKNSKTIYNLEKGAECYA